jgi:hypothetical protein
MTRVSSAEDSRLDEWISANRLVPVDSNSKAYGQTTKAIPSSGSRGRANDGTVSQVEKGWTENKHIAVVKQLF